MGERPFHTTIVPLLNATLDGNRRIERFVELCKIVAVTDLPGNWDAIEAAIKTASEEVCADREPIVTEALANVAAERKRHASEPQASSKQPAATDPDANKHRLLDGAADNGC